jgi:cation:H+ antiporter
MLEKVSSSFTKYKVDIFKTFLKIGAGVVLLVLASSQVVQSTLFFGSFFTISPFFISLLIVSLGTNIPELAIIVRSVFEKKSELALADYLGSASANTLLFGLMTLMYGKTVVLPNHFVQRFVFLSLGLILFYIFARSKNTISRRESVLLLLCYLAFVLFEAFVILE